MGTEENKAILRTTYERWWNGGDADSVDEMVADDYVDHSAVVKNRGKEGLKELIREFHQGFPDMREQLEDAIAEGDKVVGRFRMWGTHSGTFLGVPATGRRVEITGIDIFRITDGKITEMWYEDDLMSMMRQLGVLD